MIWPILAEVLPPIARRRPNRLVRSLAWRCGQNLPKDRSTRIGSIRSGGRILLDLSEYSHREVYFYGLLEEATSRLIENARRPGWSFFDIGANEGYFALFAADLGGEQARVVAVEPLPKLATLLRASVALNGYEARVTVVEAACGAAGGTSTLYESSDPRASGLATLREARTTGTVREVRVVSADALCASLDFHPDVVKIDVEGLELEVLQGMEGLLRAQVPEMLVIEVSPVSSTPPYSEVPMFLRSFGYEAHTIRADGSPGPFAGVTGENYCFLRKA